MSRFLHPVTDVLRTNEWLGKRCFVIGGGPSLRGFDWSLLRDELVIGANRAFETGVCDIVVAMDRRWWQWYKDDPQLVAHPLKVVPSSNPQWRWGFDVYWLKTKSMFYWGQDIAVGVGSGPDTGFCALNLADVLGASPIYMLGYDMKGGADGKQDWWHDGYKRRQKNHVYSRYAKMYATAAACHRIRGEIINLSPDSALECFPKAPIMSVFNASQRSQ